MQVRFSYEPALRIFAQLSGVVHDSNTILGTANGDAQQSVLGFSNPPVLAVADPVVIDILPDAPIAQRRIDGRNGAPDFDSDGDGTITCDELNTLRRPCRVPSSSIGTTLDLVRARACLALGVLPIFVRVVEL